jgi:RNA polymerase sigma-70 factor (ECF subfamily)
MGFSGKKSLTKLIFGEEADKGAAREPLPLLRQSDEQLMAAYQKGDLHAFQVLLARHQKPIFNFIYRFLKNPEAAEEGFQEVFLRLIRSRQDYLPSAKFTTWLYTLARHYCIDQLRKKKHHDHASFEEENDKLYVNPESVGRFSHAPEAYDISSARELNERLEKILNDLNPEQREVFLLRELQGLPFEEIARITGVSVNTVKSRMRYALQFLQKRFRELGVEAPD